MSSTCPHNMANFGPLAAEIDPVVWGTPANFNGFRVLAALLKRHLVVGVSQTLRRWTEGATYVRQGGHHALAHILAGSPWVFLLHLFSEWVVLYRPDILSPNHHCQSTEGITKHYKSNQWPGFILSSSTIGLLMKGVLLYVCQLSNVSTTKQT